MAAYGLKLSESDSLINSDGSLSDLQGEADRRSLVGALVIPPDISDLFSVFVALTSYLLMVPSRHRVPSTGYLGPDTQTVLHKAINISYFNSYFMKRMQKRQRGTES